MYGGQSSATILYLDLKDFDGTIKKIILMALWHAAAKIVQILYNHSFVGDF